MHRQMGQPSLLDSLLPGTLGRNERLERIGREIEWDGFDALVAGVYSAPEGRPSYPPLTMVKILLLQQWYTLSDHPDGGGARRPYFVPPFRGTGA